MERKNLHYCCLNFQIISLESIMNFCNDEDRSRSFDRLKGLAFSVFTQCRRMLSHQSTIKSLTGFGPAASQDAFLNRKDVRSFFLSIVPFRLQCFCCGDDEIICCCFRRRIRERIVCSAPPTFSHQPKTNRRNSASCLGIAGSRAAYSSARIACRKTNNGCWPAARTTEARSWIPALLT